VSRSRAISLQRELLVWGYWVNFAVAVLKTSIRDLVTVVDAPADAMDTSA
jgi:hypothetical protein